MLFPDLGMSMGISSLIGINFWHIMVLYTIHTGQIGISPLYPQIHVYNVVLLFKITGMMASWVVDNPCVPGGNQSGHHDQGARDGTNI